MNVSQAVPSSGARWSAAASRFVLVNVVGGAAVLASYAWGLAELGSEASRAWGGVPAWLRPVYQLSMLAAAAGYFPMTLSLLDAMRTSREPAPGLVTALYTCILACSALWLPLTCRMLDSPSSPLWWVLVADLAVVGAASIAVLVLVVRRGAQGRPLLRALAVAGSVAFSLQTTVLDAIVWPAFFRT